MAALGRFNFKRHLPWALAWCLLSGAGAWVLGSLALTQLRGAFEADSQTAQRLLDQKLAQNDALLVQLVQQGQLGQLGQLAQPAPAPAKDAKNRIDARPIQSHPQITAIQRREPDASWQQEPLRLAEAESRSLKRPVLADVNLAKGRYQLVLGADPTSVALLVDARALVPWREWPFSYTAQAGGSPVRASITYAGQTLVLQPGQGSGNVSGHVSGNDVSNDISNDMGHDNLRAPATAAWGWPLESIQPVGGQSQPFNLVTQRHVTWGELPWSRITTWCLAVALLLLAMRALMRQGHDRRRASDLLHVGQTGRLNTLSELATGMVQELHQPTAAALDATLLAHSLLANDPPDLAAAQLAVKLATVDAQRAANVVNRLRHVVQQPAQAGPLEQINLGAAARRALDLLAAELKRLNVRPSVTLHGPEFTVLAHSAGLAQIIHNLLINALQALEQVRPSDRKLILNLSSNAHQGQLTVQDTGPGLANNVVTRIFEPFFTTREGALGLGLSLCETTASSMGGTLTAFNRVPHGAEFCLSLPLGR